MKSVFLFVLFAPMVLFAQNSNKGQINNQLNGLITDNSQSFLNTSSGSYSGTGGFFNHLGRTFTNNGTYNVTAGTDAFQGADTQSIEGAVAPVFFTLKLNNGSNGRIDIKNTGGITVKNTLQLSNGITATLRANGAAGAIRMDSGSTYSGSLSSSRFVDGYVTKAGASPFVYPVGQGSELRRLSVSNLGAKMSNSVAWFAANPGQSSDNSGGPYNTASKQPGIITVFEGGYWDWVNLSGDSSATITLSLPTLSGFALSPADVQLVGWNTAAAQWQLIATGASGLGSGDSISGSVSDVSLYGAFGIGNGSYNTFINAKALLQAAYNTSTGLMNTALNNKGILQANALAQPYALPPFSYGGSESVPSGFFSAHPNIVDWVLVELRDSASPSSVVASRAGLLLNNGTIVEKDGSSALAFRGVPPGSYYLAVRHRNHLSIRSASPIHISAPDQLIAYDFTSAQAQAYQNPAVTSNPAMRAQSTGTFAMWGGNANADQVAQYDGTQSDKDFLLNTALGGNTPSIVTGVYNKADLNMNGNIRYSGIANDKDFLLNAVLGGAASGVIVQH